MTKSRLLLPKLVDLSQHKHKSNSARIEINNTKHKFSSESAESGVDPKVLPIFGTTSYLNGKKVSELSWGLPFFRFKRGTKPHVTFVNNTHYSFDIHWHGLNITADIDGASGEVEFGTDTKIGKELNIRFPEITNNSALLWYHAHPMFFTSSLLYSGVLGLLDIVDDNTKFITDTFQYGDNHLILAYLDLDLNTDGSINNTNLYGDAQRSCYGTLNGTCCVNWFSDDRVKYETDLYHESSRNLLKIDILNGTCSFRNLHIGICDQHDHIHNFYLIQTDTGLRNPMKTNIVTLAPANRISIMVDLNEINGSAFLFFYNFDLTEVYNMVTPTAPYPNDSSLQITVPDLLKSANPTPNPTPIPDPNNTNPNDNPSPLVYPVVPLIPQIVINAQNGIIPLPKKYTLKKVLKLKSMKSNFHANRLSSNSIVSLIRKTVFGDNYDTYNSIIKINNFELDKSLGLNYLNLLNKKYFYNIPETTNVATRDFILFNDDQENYSGSSPNGSTECCNGSLRIFTDLWNSKELDLMWAIENYNLNPNNFKPTILPTCLFKIYPTNTQFINMNMLENDTLTVQLFSNPISYGDTTTVPIASVTIVLPVTDRPLNIVQLTNLVNGVFNSTNITIGQQTSQLSTVLTFDWTFYPFKSSYITNKTAYIKTVMVKTTNNSNYFVRLSGKWPLLQFFGKPFTAMMMNMGGGAMAKLASKPLNKSTDTAFVCSKGNKCTCVKPTSIANLDAIDMADRFPNNYNMQIQEVYAGYASSDPNTPIITHNDDCELIITSNGVYLGFIDGFQSDALMNYSTKMDSSEKWVYHNLDVGDSHPLHFHFTSGFVDANDSVNSDGLVTDQNNHFPYLYSRDTYGIGPQQTIAFYLKFPKYTSVESYLELAVKNLGFMVHCHFATHHDMNMMQQYYVYKNRNDYF